MKIYFAGPLFTLAEKNFNRALRDELVAIGHTVFLPQESEANKREVFDHAEVARDDERQVYANDILIANLDGAMVDDGTGVEVGLARRDGKITVGYRTDFRICGDDPKIHVNLMFRLMDDVVLYTGESIPELAQKIHEAIMKVAAEKQRS